MEEGGDFKMVWEGSSVGVLLKLGRCSIDQEPCVKEEPVFCKEARVGSYKQGRRQMERILP